MSPRRRRNLNLGEAINRGVRGPRAPRTTTIYRQVKDLINTYGERGAAERLEVGIRTLRSWVHPDRSKRRAPSKANRDRIGSEHNTRQVRQATAPRRRMRRFARKGIRVHLTGMAGPVMAGKNYQRRRDLIADLPPEAAQAIMDAFLEGGPEQAEQAFKEAMYEHYHDEEWRFDDLSEFRFDESTRYDDH